MEYIIDVTSPRRKIKCQNKGGEEISKGNSGILLETCLWGDAFNVSFLFCLVWKEVLQCQVAMMCNTSEIRKDHCESCS